MIYERMRGTDLSASKIGIGAWQFGESAWGYGKDYTEEDIIKAIEASSIYGVNFIDTAEVYGGGLSEEIVGKAIKRVKRLDRFYIFTKVSGAHLRYDDVIKACEGSLKRLGVEAIDLYQVHWPNFYVPIEETMRAMEKLVEDGKVRYIGVSNFPVSLLEEAEKALKNNVIVSNQVKYNLLERDIEKEILPYAQKKKIAILAYSPLAMGLLTGKYDEKNLPEDELRKNNPLFRNPENLRQIVEFVNFLRELALDYSVTISQIALNWLMVKEGIFAIAGVKNEKQAVTNALAAEIKLSEEDYELIDKKSKELRLTYF